MSVAVEADTYVVSSSSGLIRKLSSAAATTAPADATATTRVPTRPPNTRLARATVSMAANARMGAGTIEYSR
jgi:hypothetical protein